MMISKKGGTFKVPPFFMLINSSKAVRRNLTGILQIPKW